MAHPVSERQRIAVASVILDVKAGVLTPTQALVLLDDLMASPDAPDPCECHDRHPRVRFALGCLGALGFALVIGAGCGGFVQAVGIVGLFASLASGVIR